MGARNSKAATKGPREADKPTAETPSPTTPITLYVILPLSNPVKFVRRKQLFDQTVEKLRAVQARLVDSKQYARVCIVSSSLEYVDVSHRDTEVIATADRVEIKHYTHESHVLWAKENLINLAIAWLLANRPDAQHIAWVDADIEFDGVMWVKGTIDALDSLATRGARGGFVQMFETAVLLGRDGAPSHSVTSFGKQHSLGKPFVAVANSSPEYWHPGFAWAADAKTLRMLHESFEGAALLEKSLGGADTHMAMALLGCAEKSIPADLSSEYRDMVMRWQGIVQEAGCKLGVVPGVIKHYWHGQLVNRRYMERWDVLIKNNFIPNKHMARRSDGVLEWLPAASPKLSEEVLSYFVQRDEDDIFRNDTAAIALAVVDNGCGEVVAAPDGSHCHHQHQQKHHHDDCHHHDGSGGTPHHAPNGVNEHKETEALASYATLN